MAARIGGSIKDSINPVAQNFLRDMPFVIAASVDAEGDTWASGVSGPTGFIEVLGDRIVRIRAKGAEPQLLENVRATGRLGLLAIEFDTRLRMRLNGSASVSGGFIEIEAEEVFSNCHKYIQSREPAVRATTPRERSTESSSLSDPQRKLIETADTFFIATYAEGRGADASHRGGNPGFVKVRHDGTVVFPDYSGNNMFQTLGNIETNGKAGLLFIEFETGRTLQMTGWAEILWDEEEFDDLPGAQRAVRFTVVKVRETEGAFPSGWKLVDYSPANP